MLIVQQRHPSIDGWVDETGWTQTSDVCGWAGVTCNDPANDQGEDGNDQGEDGTAQGTTIVAIDMDANGLTGSLPMDLALLSSLRSLTLSNNNIVGELPPSLFIMASLEELYIDNNMIESELVDLSGLTSITAFYASDNILSGDVSVFWDLTTLENLVLDDNSFTGTLDGVSALQSLGKWIPLFFVSSLVETKLKVDE